MEWYVVHITYPEFENDQMMSENALHANFEFRGDSDSGYWQNIYYEDITLTITYAADSPALVAQELQRIYHGG